MDVENISTDGIYGKDGERLTSHLDMFIMSRSYDGINFTHQGIPRQFAILRSTVFGIFTFFIIVGNLFCLVVLYRSTDIRKVTRLFMVSLTLADLFHGLGAALPTLMLQLFADKIHRAHIVCYVVELTTMVTKIASIFSLVSVNLDRYISIEWPLKSASMLTYTRAKMATVFIWTFAGLALFLNYLHRKPPQQIVAEWVVCIPIGTRRDESIIVTIMLCFIFFIAIPFLLTVFMQIRILVIVRRHNASIHGYSRDSHQRQNSLRRDTKVLKMFMVVIFTYVIAWLPFVSLTFHELRTGNRTHPYLRTIFIMLLLCTHWWNVCVYVARNRTFRSSAVNLLKNFIACKICKSGSDTYSSNERCSDELPV